MPFKWRCLLPSFKAKLAIGITSGLCLVKTSQVLYYEKNPPRSTIPNFYSITKSCTYFNDLAKSNTIEKVELAFKMLIEEYIHKINESLQENEYNTLDIYINKSQIHFINNLVNDSIVNFNHKEYSNKLGLAHSRLAPIIHDSQSLHLFFVLLVNLIATTNNIDIEGFLRLIPEHIINTLLSDNRFQRIVSAIDKTAIASFCGTQEKAISDLRNNINSLECKIFINNLYKELRLELYRYWDNLNIFEDDRYRTLYFGQRATYLSDDYDIGCRLPLIIPKINSNIKIFSISNRNNVFLSSTAYDALDNAKSISNSFISHDAKSDINFSIYSKNNVNMEHKQIESLSDFSYKYNTEKSLDNLISNDSSDYIESEDLRQQIYNNLSIFLSNDISFNIWGDIIEACREIICNHSIQDIGLASIPNIIPKQMINDLIYKWKIHEWNCKTTGKNLISIFPNIHVSRDYSGGIQAHMRGSIAAEEDILTLHSIIYPLVSSAFNFSETDLANKRIYLGDIRLIQALPSTSFARYGTDNQYRGIKVIIPLTNVYSNMTHPQSIPKSHLFSSKITNSSVVPVKEYSINSVKSILASTKNSCKAIIPDSLTNFTNALKGAILCGPRGPFIDITNDNETISYDKYESLPIFIKKILKINDSAKTEPNKLLNQGDIIILDSRTMHRMSKSTTSVTPAYILLEYNIAEFVPENIRSYPQPFQPIPRLDSIVYKIARLRNALISRLSEVFNHI